MKLYFEQTYPHPIEKVWRAITTSEGLERWLMRNDFEARIGRACVFRFCADGESKDTRVDVLVERLDAPHFMQWRWQSEGEPNATIVSFELEETDGGTLLRLRHEGDIDPLLAERLEQGWPTKLAALRDELAR